MTTDHTLADDQLGELTPDHTDIHLRLAMIVAGTMSLLGISTVWLTQTTLLGATLPSLPAMTVGSATVFMLSLGAFVFLYGILEGSFPFFQGVRLYGVYSTVMAVVTGLLVEGAVSVELAVVFTALLCAQVAGLAMVAGRGRFLSLPESGSQS
jgi:hypothetical protein